MSKTAAKDAIEKVLSEAGSPASAPILYDSRTPQRLRLDLEKNGREYVVYHTLNPLSNARYFEYQNECMKAVERVKKFTTSILDPQHRLWDELAESRDGYKERPDWKEATHPNDKVAALSGLLYTRVLDEAEVDEPAVSKSAVYDEKELTVITFKAIYGNASLTLTHSFREETKAEADEYLAIESNQTNENAIASAEKISKAERLYRLGIKLLAETEGYADGSEIPAWHVAATTQAFFLRQSNRMGKFLVP